ncbi:hypothetical protein NBRC111893_2462 [Lentilactobacillus kosonis]|uniref:Uncharacterized protein n=1 Tax=Lentilactobacillus kosonis TaxID=2810561 RepID=A0A401FPT1_9LACO|nr:hypothetical protein NBRC111893_2462 [Lentilactobacillus kosonis]
MMILKRKKAQWRQPLGEKIFQIKFLRLNDTRIRRTTQWMRFKEELKKLAK